MIVFKSSLKKSNIISFFLARIGNAIIGNFWQEVPIKAFRFKNSEGFCF